MARKAKGKESEGPEEVAAEVLTDADGDEVTAETHICVDGSYVKHPEAAEKPRRLSLNGQNVEHVDTDALGVWCYRSM